MRFRVNYYYTLIKLYLTLIISFNNFNNYSSAAEDSAGEGKKWVLSHQGLNGTEITTKDLASYVGEMPEKDLMNWEKL